MNDVTIVGGGPTGLMLAGELALAGVDVVILERRSTPDLVGTRARGFHSRTIEIFDQRGIADRFLAEGRTVQAMSFANTALEVASLPTRHPYTLGLSQSHIERILRGWVEELGRADPSRARGHRLRPGRRGRRRPPRRGRPAAHGLPGRCRWRAQRHPQGSRHRRSSVRRRPGAT